MRHYTCNREHAPLRTGPGPSTATTLWIQSPRVRVHQARGSSLMGVCSMSPSRILVPSAPPMPPSTSQVALLQRLPGGNVCGGSGGAFFDMRILVHLALATCRDHSSDAHGVLKERAKMPTQEHRVTLGTAEDAGLTHEGREHCGGSCRGLYGTTFRVEPRHYLAKQATPHPDRAGVENPPTSPLTPPSHGGGEGGRGPSSERDGQAKKKNSPTTL